MPPISPELWLQRRNGTADITEAASAVDAYIPIPAFKPSPSQNYTTTIVSAFFPPPNSEALMRSMGGDPFARDPEEYIQALQLMAKTCDNLVLFVPPGRLAEQLRAEPTGITVYDDYRSVWDLPPLSPYKEEFYERQPFRYRHGGCRGPAFYGEPHSWAAWNAKAFFVLEALQRDPFQTSHFIWLDARVPSFVSSIKIWPHPYALERAYSVMPTDDRVILSAMRPLRPVGTEYWPRLHTDGTTVQAYMSDIHAIVANLYFGTKPAMARLARAQLILLHRDLARGYFVGREEYQLSYLHFEFLDLTYTLDLYSHRDYAPGVDWYSFAYWYMGVPGHDWRGLGLEADPVESAEDTDLFCSLDSRVQEEEERREPGKGR